MSEESRRPPESYDGERLRRLARHLDHVPGEVAAGVADALVRIAAERDDAESDEAAPSRRPASDDERFVAAMRAMNEINPAAAIDEFGNGWTAVFGWGWKAAERHHAITAESKTQAASEPLDKPTFEDSLAAALDLLADLDHWVTAPVKVGSGAYHERIQKVLRDCGRRAD